MKRILTLLLLTVAISISSNAQVKKRTPAPQPKAPTAAQILHENLLEATQRVLIVDSIVVAKDSFLSYIPLPPECGKIEPTEYGYQFTNEFGDRMLYSIADTAGNARIYTKSKEGDEWGKRQFVESLGEPSNYPFLMSDGITLYFSHKGEGSLGGYDIFITRYDAEDNTYLKAQNIGYPFNSNANDYMYVVDEVDTLGWFVTDRRQPEGRVCVYTFVPPLSRENLSIETEGLSTVRSRAALTSIADTWDGHYVELALAERRLKQMKEREYKPVKVNTFSFIINDDITYTSEDDFKVVENKTRLDQLKEMQQMLAKSEKELEDARVKYHNANRFDRSALGAEIMKAEKELQQLRLDIASMNRRIRNDEIRAINN